ncbi:hypothetical protein AB4305_14040 [Nocardia sp. 2YAB30]|uniref:hypothetical protein n=1 Tax=unclassified Nocardia TaxID=2637762 RepID=UPI003F94E437
MRLIAERSLRRGELTAAVAALIRAAAAIEELRSAGDAAAVGAELTTVLARLGELDRAEAASVRARAHAEAAGETRTVVYVRVAHAELLLRRGDRQAALRELDRTMTGLGHSAFASRIRLLCTAFRAMIALLDDDAETARHTLAAADLDGAHTADLAMLAHSRAALAVHEGDHTAAANLIGIAAGLFGTEDQRGYDNLLAPADHARAALGAAFTAEYECTASLPPEAAVAYLRSHATRPR